MGNIYVFTTNKAASMLLYELAKPICRRARMPFWSINDGTFPEKGLAEDPHAFDGKEGCFCPLRYYTEVPDVAESDIILHLRDPRDAITSQFFSLAYSHPPVGAFNPTEAQREEWRQAGIDEHARTHADRWVKRYQDYCDNLLGRPNTTFLRYEDMVSDFPTWLERFVAPFPVARKEALVRKLARKYRHNFDVKHEDVRRQKRQVTPGDHKRKLQPDTITFLNDKFAAILPALGYEP
jgi:hypothetical protein